MRRLALSCLLLFSLLPGLAHGLERTPARINSWPPMFGDYCWVTNHLAFDIPDTLCYDLIWNWSGFHAGDVVGMGYVGSQECGSSCAVLNEILIYFPAFLHGPGDEVRVQLVCADEAGAPIGDPLASVDLNPESFVETVTMETASLPACTSDGALRYVVTLCWLTDSGYPHIATDNMETIQDMGCDFPAGYPRSDPSQVRSRIFPTTAACAPTGAGDPFHDDLDNLELVWTIAMTCQPNAVVPSTWGHVKSLFR